MEDHVQNQKEEALIPEIGPMHKLSDNAEKPYHSTERTIWDELSDPANFGNGKAIMLSFSKGKLAVIKQP